MVHEGKLPSGIESFNHLINLMKESAFVINSILNDYREKSKDVS